MLPAARILVFASIAFVLGALAGGALLWEGPPIRIGAGSAPLTVVVQNTGTHDAAALIEVDELDGDVHERASVPIPRGGAGEHRVLDPLRGQVSVKVTVSWSVPGDSARGDTIRLVEPGDCERGELARLTVRVDTSNGVAFRGSTLDCVPV